MSNQYRERSDLQGSSLLDAQEGYSQLPLIILKKERIKAVCNKQFIDNKKIVNKQYVHKIIIKKVDSRFNSSVESPLQQIPEEPTIDNQMITYAQYELSYYEGHRRSMRQSKSQSLAQLPKFYQDCCNSSNQRQNSKIKSQIVKNISQFIYGNTNQQCYYLSALRGTFLTPQKNHTDIQKSYSLHFSQTFTQVQSIPQFNYPTAKLINSKLICLPPQVHEKGIKLQIYIKVKKTLILDLDETMVHCNEDLNQKADFYLNISISYGFNIKAGVRVRPHLIEFLKEMNRLYEVIVFTASQRVYAEAVLNKIDSNGQLVHYLFSRESCIVDKGCFIKDLRVIKGREMKNVILVDNSTLSFIHQLENGVPIIPFYSNDKDCELLSLSRFLVCLADVQDVRDSIKQYFQLHKLDDYLEAKEASDTLYQF